MIRLKFLSEVNPSLPHDRIPRPEDSVSFLPMDHIGENGELDLTDTRPAKEISRGYTAFLEKDVVVAKITPCFENGKGAICQGLRGGVGFGTTELIVLRPKEPIDPRFLYWLTRSHEFRKGGEAEMTGSAGQKRVTEAFVSNFRVPPISFQHQRRIAAYLDRQREKIDRLINLRKRQIALLKEQRAAIIQRAVTRGLNPHAPMKDSGIPWLGEIPTHWEVKKLKYAVQKYGLGIQMGPFGSMLTKLQPFDVGFKVFGQENTINNDFNLGSRWISETQFEELKKYEILTGDIVLTRKGSIGQCRLVPPDIKRGIIDSDTIRLRIDQKIILSKFLVWIFQESKYILEQLNFLQRGAILGGLNTAIIENLVLSIPPLDEQLSILSHLKKICLSFELGISAYSRQLALLAEYRAALIHECVTGRKEIPEMPSPAREVAHAL